MSVFDVGRVCIKTKGRNAGRKCVVISVEKGFAIIEGDFMKKKRCNVMHLFPTSHKISVSKSSSHEDIVKHLKGVKI